MMLAADELRVVPTTVHIPLAACRRALTRALIVETVRITATALVEDFGIARPAHRRRRSQPARRRGRHSSATRRAT